MHARVSPPFRNTETELIDPWGPLLDGAGRLIEVNAAIFSPSGASAGVGFAVPVDTVKRVVTQLIARGTQLSR